MKNISEEIISVIKNSRFFDEKFYKSNFKLDWKKYDPVIHYCLIGDERFVNPSQGFDSKKYYMVNPDVYTSNINALYHYEKYGRLELRKKWSINEPFDIEKYTANKRICKNPQINGDNQTKSYLLYFDISKGHDISLMTRCQLEALKIKDHSILYFSLNYKFPHEINKIEDLIEYYDCENLNNDFYRILNKGLSYLYKIIGFKNCINLMLLFNNIVGPICAFDEYIEFLDSGDPIKITSWQNFINKNILFCKFNGVNSNTKIQEILAELCEEKNKKSIHAIMDDSNLAYEKIGPFNKQKYKSSHELPALFLYDYSIKNSYSFNDLKTLYRHNKGLYNLYVQENKIHFDNIKNISFSIICPTYNRAEFIINALDSVINQTYKNFELIIVDDASQDDTEAIINKKYGLYIKAGKFKYHKLLKNQGPGAARNAGLKIAHNEWIAYLDSDNVLEDNFLEEFVNAISANPDYSIFYGKFTSYPYRTVIGEPYDRDKLINKNFIDIGVFVHRKNLIEHYGNFSTSLKTQEDYDFILKLTTGEYPYFIDKSLIKYNNGDHARVTTNNDHVDDYMIINRKYNKKEIISCIITSYNSEDYIARAIDSVMTQDAKSYIKEVIIADDGSSDNSPSIINKFANKYPDVIKNLSHKKNLGIPLNMKNAIHASRGKWIAFLEGDDYWLDTYKLESHVNFMRENYDCQMCFNGSILYDQTNLKTIYPPHQQNLPKLIPPELIIELSNPIMSFSSTFFKSETLKNLPDAIYFPLFSEFVLALYLCNFGKIGFLSLKQTIYRLHNKSVWSSLNEESKKIYKIKVRKQALKFSPVKVKPLLFAEINNLTA